MVNIYLRKEKKRDDKSQRNERFIGYACLCICNLIFDFGVDVLKSNLVVELRVSGERCRQNGQRRRMTEVLGLGKNLRKPICTRNTLLLTDEDLEKRKESRIPKNTKRNTTWAVGVWKGWTEERNVKAKALGPNKKLVNSDIVKISNLELNYRLAKLVVEIRKKGEKGEYYPPAILYQLCCGLPRYLRNNDRPALNIFEDSYFKHFQDSIDAEVKRLTGLGVSANVKQAAAFTEDQKEKLWNLNLLEDHSSSVLLKSIVFLVGKNFALRSDKEHRSLKFSHLTVEPACGNEPEKLVYVSFGEKNNLGGLKHRAVERKRIEHYANGDCPTRCLVRLYKKYVETYCPVAIAKDVFYLSPRQKYRDSDEGI